MSAAGSLIALFIFLLAFLFLSVFKKHILFNLAIFFLALGCLIAYFETGLGGFVFILVALISVCGYELYEMTKMRW